MKGFRAYILPLLLFFCLGLQAQDDSTKKDDADDAPSDTPATNVDWDQIKERLVFGGSIGYSYFTPFSVYQISPQVGYKLKEELILGGGIQFFGASSKFASYVQYGPDVFLRQHLIRTFFVQAQFEYINFENYILPGKRIWNPAFLAGFGWGTYGYSIGLFTDLVQTENSQYVYPGNIFIGPRTGQGRYPYGVPFFFRAQLFF
jgi:hypothetical protein